MFIYVNFHIHLLIAEHTESLGLDMTSGQTELIRDIERVLLPAPDWQRRAKNTLILPPRMLTP